MKLSPREKNKIINIGSMIILFILALLLLYLPKIRTNNRRSQEILKLSGDLKKLVQISQNPGEFKEEENEILDSLKAIHKKITTQPMIPQAISQITGPAKELDISIIEIKPQTAAKRRGMIEPTEPMPPDIEFPNMDFEGIPTSKKSCIETKIDLSIQCTYEQLCLYLDRLRHLDRLVILNELNIRKNERIFPELEIRLEISIFNFG